MGFKVLSLMMFSFLLFQGPVVQAAVPSKNKVKKSLTALQKLNLPSQRRFDSFRKKGSDKVLSGIAFSKTYTLGQRWRAMTVLAKLYPRSSGVAKALRHKRWNLRNSALLGLSESNKKLAMGWAIKYLNSDPSLIVRSAAVDILAKNPSSRAKKALRNNINNKLNFRKGKPLWVRKNILQAVYQMSTKNDLPHLISNLGKKLDPQHSKYLLQALPRISGHTINTTPYGSEKKAWIDWWGTRKTVSR